MAIHPMLPMLVACMLVTGAANTLLTKYQDMQCVANCDSPDPSQHRLFEQPVVQTLQMMMGEGGCCWAVIFIGWLYNRSRRLDSTTPAQDIVYEAVNTEEPQRRNDTFDSDDDNDPQTGRDVIDPTTIVVAKPLHDPTAKKQLVNKKPLRGRKILLLALPSCCDILGTTTMQVGLLFVAASIYQMTRGALVLFVGLFSVVFLGRHLGAWKWASLIVVVVGIAIVGLAGVIEHKDTIPHLPGVETTDERTTAARTILGVMLVAGAQVFVAAQFCIEEAILARYDLDELKVVAWEGTFGCIVTSFLMIAMHLAVGRTPAGHGGYFDIVTAFDQIISNTPLLVSSVLTMASIAGFNFFGLSITAKVSATARSTLDSCRTLVIWLVSLGLGWESFKWLQIIGFVLVVYGTGIFNEIIRPPTINYMRRHLHQGEV